MRCGRAVDPCGRQLVITWRRVDPQIRHRAVRAGPRRDSCSWSRCSSTGSAQLERVGRVRAHRRPAGRAGRRRRRRPPSGCSRPTWTISTGACMPWIVGAAFVLVARPAARPAARASARQDLGDRRLAGARRRGRDGDRRGPQPHQGLVRGRRRGPRPAPARRRRRPPAAADRDRRARRALEHLAAAPATEEPEAGEKS